MDEEDESEPCNTCEGYYFPEELDDNGNCHMCTNWLQGREP
jgi:hypothetical protein